MKTNALTNNLVGFLNNGFGHTSSSKQRDREWNIIKDAAANTDIAWGNPSMWIAKANPVVRMVKGHLNKWHPHTGVDSDLISHFAQSLVLAQALGANQTASIGLITEWFDGWDAWLKNDSQGAGYSNDDLAADLAGAYGYTATEALNAGLFSHTRSEDYHNDWFLNGNTGFIDNLKKIWDLWDDSVVQSATDESDAESLIASNIILNTFGNKGSLSGYMVAGFRNYGVVLASSAANAQNGLGFKGDIHHGSWDVEGVVDPGAGITLTDTNDDGLWTNRSVSLSWPAFEQVYIRSYNFEVNGYSVSVPAGSASISFDPQVDGNFSKAWPVSISYTRIIT
jgi:hypothetical protein